ncbi:MAG: methyltransferase [Myxococcales bacterium]|nr:methyltransferase [Myxococcales bacterium]
MTLLAELRPVRLAFLPELSLRLSSSLEAHWQEREPPWWTVAWVGGQALARFVLDHPARVRGRRVLDFGAGSGLVGLAAAAVGARVSAVDVDPAAIEATRVNAEDNGVSIDARCVDVIGQAVDVDVILAGDVCYDAAMAERVLPWLFERAGAGVEVWLADPGRRYLPRAGLVELARHEVPSQGGVEGEATRSVAVYAVTRG